MITLLREPIVSSIRERVRCAAATWQIDLLLPFGDLVMATAVLDRIFHHLTTINITNNSYRLREKVKAGLISEPEDEDN